MPVPYCLDDCGFVVEPEVRQVDSSSSILYMYHSFLSHSSTDGHLGCFHVLAIINSAVMNIALQVSLSILVSLVCMPRSGISGSYGSFGIFQS